MSQNKSNDTLKLTAVLVGIVGAIACIAIAATDIHPSYDTTSNKVNNVPNEEILEIEKSLLLSMNIADNICYDQKTGKLFAHSTGSNNTWDEGWYMEDRTNLEFIELSNGTLVLSTDEKIVFNDKRGVDPTGLICTARPTSPTA